MVRFFPSEVNLDMSLGRDMDYVLESFPQRCCFDHVLSCWKPGKKQWAIGIGIKDLFTSGVLDENFGAAKIIPILSRKAKL